MVMCRDVVNPLNSDHMLLPITPVASIGSPKRHLLLSNVCSVTDQMLEK